MERNSSHIRIFSLDEYNYPKFRGKIIDLYMRAFTTGEYAQYIPKDSAESTLDEMLRNGFGNMTFIKDKLVGALIALPLKKDKDFPKEEATEIPIEKSLYIAEVMVDADCRGLGIASQMIEDLLRQVSAHYSHAVIRVWNENVPALSLYEKLGFTPTGAKITQTKNLSEKETFEMDKIYLQKVL